MSNHPILIKKLALMSVGVAMMMILVTSAKAEEHVIRRHTFDPADVTEIDISKSVSSIEVVPVFGTQMRITVEIEARERGWLRRHADVVDMDVSVRERGNALYLAFDEKHATAEWLIEMPAVAYTTINMGVGELDIDIGATELDIDLGVGDVNIHASERSVGRIKLDVAVGEAGVRGGEIIEHDTAFISQSIRAEGKGRHDINVGVGEAGVRRN